MQGTPPITSAMLSIPGKCHRGRAQSEDMARLALDAREMLPRSRTIRSRLGLLGARHFSEHLFSFRRRTHGLFISFSLTCVNGRSYHHRVPSELLDPAFGFYDFVDLVFESGELVQDRQAATALVVKDSFYLAILVD